VKKVTTYGLFVGFCFAVLACVSPLQYPNAYKSATVFGEVPKRGLILYLHSCDGDSPSFDWANFLTSAGFLIVAPNSFADPRPPASCRAPYPAKEQIYDIRLAQTKYALKELRAAYPTTKIFVWGNSEGGGLANLLDEKVDGIVTTGYQCGYRTMGRTWIRRDVPLLAIMGTADSYMLEVQRTTGRSLEAMCSSILTSRKWEFLIIDGMGHHPAFSVYPEIKSRLTKFLGIE
jgi:dienelactone hydrolase